MPIRTASRTFTVETIVDGVDGVDPVVYRLCPSVAAVRKAGDGTWSTSVLRFTVQKITGTEITILSTVRQLLDEKIDIIVEGGAHDEESVMADLAATDTIWLTPSDYYTDGLETDLDSLTFRMEIKQTGSSWKVLDKLEIGVVEGGQDARQVVMDASEVLFNASTTLQTRILTFRTIRGSATQSSGYAACTAASVQYYGQNSHSGYLTVTYTGQTVSITSQPAAIAADDYAIVELTFSNGQIISIAVRYDVGATAVLPRDPLYLLLENPVQYVEVDESWQNYNSDIGLTYVLHMYDGDTEINIAGYTFSGVDWNIIRDISTDPNYANRVIVTPRSDAIIDEPIVIGCTATDSESRTRSTKLTLVPWQHTEGVMVERKYVQRVTGTVTLNPATDTSSWLLSNAGACTVTLPVAANNVGVLYTFIASGPGHSAFYIYPNDGDAIYNGATDCGTLYLPNGVVRLMAIKTGAWAVISGSEYL